MSHHRHGSEATLRRPINHPQSPPSERENPEVQAARDRIALFDSQRSSNVASPTLGRSANVVSPVPTAAAKGKGRAVAANDTREPESQGRFDNDLSENLAPQPISRGEPRRRSLEEREAAAQRTQPQNDLSANIAPKPVRRGEPRRRDSLENAEEGVQKQPRSENAGRISGWPTQLYTIANLVFFSFLGTLARLGMQWLTFYPGAPVEIANLWANVAGTLVMGFLVEDRKLFMEEWGSGNNSFSGKPEKRRKKEEDDEDDGRGTAEKRKAHGKVKKTIPLFIGLTTGFCGSFTSFSTFMRDVFFALANILPTPVNHPQEMSASIYSTVNRNGGYSFMAVIAVVVLTVGMCVGSLFVGAHLAIALDRVTPSLPFKFVRKLMDPLFVFLALGCWIGAVILAIFPPDRPTGPASRGTWANEVWRGEVLFALVFAPIGCLLRYYLSLRLNSIQPAFPLGTFAANIFGTAVIGMCYDLQHVPLATAGIGGGRVGCQVLQGIEDGFCGCLTTVSTWVVELTALRRTHGYFYGLSSVALGLSMLVVIMGSVKWTIGFDQAACVTMRTSLS